jgi:hypothetical protein
MRKKESVNQESKGRNHMSLMSTEQHVSAQMWTCTRCGGEDPKSCGCSAATATSREIREKLATKYEQDRQRSKAYRERSATGQLAQAKSVLADNPGISASKLKKLSGSNIAMCRRALRETASRDAPVENIDESPAASAERMKAQFAAKEDGAPRDILLQYARQAGALTKEWRKSQIENDAELSAAATNAAESWREIASALTEFDDDDDDSFHEGALDKLVARQQRFERQTKKSDEAIKDFRREEQPGIEALAARLVKLDVDVARQVFNALATRGPCGRMEGVNFFLSRPFARALQRALDDTEAVAPACAAAS